MFTMLYAFTATVQVTDTTTTATRAVRMRERHRPIRRPEARSVRVRPSSRVSRRSDERPGDRSETVYTRYRSEVQTIQNILVPVFTRMYICMYVCIRGTRVIIIILRTRERLLRLSHRFLKALPRPAAHVPLTRAYRLVSSENRY